MVLDGSLPRKSNLSALQVGKEYTFLRQLHDAARAGLHEDLRIGSPEIGLQSFAVPKARMPEVPGESLLAIQQPQHRFSYGSFEGTIPEGRGKGTVKLSDTGKAMITEASPGKIRFALLHPRNPKEYLLTRKEGDNWFLTNVNSTTSDAERYGKEKYGVTKDPESLLAPGVTVSPKIDGAAIFMRLLANRADVSSIRPSVAGGPLKHTWRIGGLDRLQIPPSLRGLVLRGELYGKQGNRVIPAAQLGGLLNTSTVKSKQAQQEAGIRLLVALYGLADSGGKLAPEDRVQLRKMFSKVEQITGGTAHPLQEADTPEAGKKLLDLIRSGKHPLTKEGTVLFQPGQRPVKYLLPQEADVYIREIFPAETSGTARAGGFAYSNEPDGEIVGRVGSGFIHADAQDMLANPGEWIGRKARISAKEQFPSGAWRAPVFVARHEG